ncbi:MAG: 16S rRNA (cytosine(1402)-N(4))-methyltransferase RsmH [Rhodospirillales bacterium]|nr:16S rRNA (cytosine(1402)-N(4))-methyltransferase RsmH [Rhodospirillales bacterium]
MNSSNQHTPVLLQEVLEALSPAENETYVDGTFGKGGYTRAILNAANCKVIAIDRDPEALPRAQVVKQDYPNRFTLLQGCFGNMDELIEQKVNGVALDIGVSSMQIDNAERGFSFREDGPLDMRMSRSGTSAADVVNNYSEKELADIIYKYGEERASRAIAKAIIKARKETPFTSTKQFAYVVRSVVYSSKKDKIDPATRTFQGLRIYVNDELGELERGLQAAENILEVGGRLAVVSFHSLEDRIVKTFLKNRSGNAPRGNRYLPESESKGPTPTFKMLSRKAIGPTDAEVEANPRARSARLRTAIRTDAPSRQEKEAA